MVFKQIDKLLWNKLKVQKQTHKHAYGKDGNELGCKGQTGTHTVNHITSPTVQFGGRGHSHSQPRVQQVRKQIHLC